MKVLEIIIAIIRACKHRLIQNNEVIEDSDIEERGSVWERVWAILRPEIYMVNELLEENRSM